MLHKKNYLFCLSAILIIISNLPLAGQSEKQPVKKPSDTNEKICPVYSISMNKICKEWDGQWQGMTVASDGACYFSSSTHSKSHGAGFHKFEPETKKHTLLSEDMTITQT